MTKKQKAYVVKKIKADCGEAHNYFNEEDPSKTCVIGAFIPKTFRHEILMHYNCEVVSELPQSLKEHLLKVTGLTIDQLRVLQVANDSVDDNTSKRRLTVLKKLKAITK